MLKSGGEAVEGDDEALYSNGKALNGNDHGYNKIVCGYLILMSMS